eukprot:TRINITY_DN29508_c0_g1_i2.p1 TRINITY_DN29508_c0_g1~~TRINITY_DN29508_c0_g1_i2.p1  ORF type:complete len:248 (-),score=57.97 TRINITY_DN29508_c0_g1_i2:21-764(-)
MLGDSTLVADPATVAALRTSLSEDSHAEVRREAVTAFESLADPADPNTIAVLTACLEDDEGSVRRATVAAIRSFTQRTGHDDVVIARVMARLEHGNAQVRAAAMEALGIVAPRGHQHSISAAAWELVSQRQLDDPGLQEAAEETFAKVADLAAVQQRLDHPDSLVRLASLKALPYVVAKGDEAALAAARELLRDPDCEVKAAAERTIAAIAENVVEAQEVSMIVTAGRAQLDTGSDHKILITQGYEV